MQIFRYQSSFLACVLFCVGMMAQSQSHILWLQTLDKSVLSSHEKKYASKCSEATWTTALLLSFSSLVMIFRCPFVLVSYSSTVLLSCYPLVLLSCCPLVVLSCCTNVPLCCCTTVILSYLPDVLCPTVLLYYCLVELLSFCLIFLL